MNIRQKKREERINRANGGTPAAEQPTVAVVKKATKAKKAKKVIAPVEVAIEPVISDESIVADLVQPATD